MQVSGLAWRQAFLCVCMSIFVAWLPSSAAAAVTASYSDIVSADSGQCVAIAGNSAASGAGVVQVSCAGQGNTTWSFVPVGANYHIVLQGSGLCLNVPGGSRASGTPLIQYSCQGDTLTNDQWTITAVGASYRIVSVSSGMCLNVNGGSRASGAQLIQYPCQGATALNDQFNLYLPVAAFSNIVSASSGRCLTISGNSTNAGTAIVQGACSTQSNAGWSLLPAGSGYHVVSQRTGQCLNVSGGTGGSGTPLIQYPCQSDAQTNDQWTVAAASGSNYRLVSVASGMCANVSGGALTDGAALVQYPCQGATALNDQFTLGLPQSFPVTLPSAWSPVIPLPVNPIGIANVPNGKLVMWSADQTFSFQNDVGNTATQTQTALFDPATNRATQFLETSAGSDMFCPGTAMLSDGRLLVNGGDSSPKTTLYDWNSNTWSASATMNIPRGYQGDTLLSNGSVLTLGGSWSGGQGGKSAEVWNGANWTVLSGVPETGIVGPDPQGIYRGDNHLWLFAQSNGSVFHAGPSAQMNWISTSGSGTIQSAGTRGADPYSINGTASLYDIGKILKTGGAKSYQQNGSASSYASNAVYQIDITRGPNQPVTVQRLNGMTYQRAFANSVILPDGSIVMIGGQSLPMPFTDTTAIMVPEIWNPKTQRFNLLKPMQTPRTYHSTAILLPDGRVFAGGGGQCGTGCVNNHLNAEILTPPYLLNADGSPAARPAIASAPSAASRGASIEVATRGPVASFVLMRLSSVTHTTNNDQRRIPLAIVNASGTSYRLAIPSDAGVVLPGYYMLFALDANGVPSVSTSLQIS